MSEPSEQPVQTSGYEQRDVHAGGLLIFAIVFACAVALVLLAGFGLYRFVAASSPFANVSPNLQPQPAPPQPRLEPEPSNPRLPGADLERVQQEEASRVGPDAWKWLDADHKFARIPLSDAMDLAVDRGLPAALPPAPGQANLPQPPASAAHGPAGAP